MRPRLWAPHLHHHLQFPPRLAQKPPPPWDLRKPVLLQNVSNSTQFSLGDSCYGIETTFGITFAQFYQWNPSGMSPVPPTLVLSWCYITSMMEKILLFACAYLTWRQWEAIARTCGRAMRIAWRDLLQPPPQSSRQATSLGLTSPTQSGIASNCDEYYTVVSGDLCSKIETQFDITFAQLYQWNPAIGSNCESLWMGYAVCVAVSS